MSGSSTYFRVYSGTLQAGSKILNANTGRTERAGRVLEMHANHREEREEIFAGDIVAAVGLKQTATGDTLCDPNAPIKLETIEFPEPVISVSIEPKTKADQEKMSTALARAGRGGPHLPGAHRRGDRPDAHLGHGRAAPRGDRGPDAARVQGGRQCGPSAGGLPGDGAEPVEKIAGRFVRQTGGRGQYGHAVINLEPAPGEGFDFVNKIRGGSIPSEFIPAVEQGIEEALSNGVKAGYPMVDLRVTLVDGSSHDVDSSEMAFKVAGSMAFREAARRAKPVLLEPIMAVEVVTPEEFMGDVIGDLNRRRGRIEGMEPRGNAQVINAYVPLAQMFGYATDLRSQTQGRATYTMQFDSYAEVPTALAEEITEHRAGTPVGASA